MAISRVALRLARWLGPWTGQDVVATGVERGEIALDPCAPSGDQLAVWRYRPTQVRSQGCMLIVPGLHFLGPTDPRLSRVARAFAASGITCYVPFIPSCMALRLDPIAVNQTAQLFDFICEHEEHRAIGVFTISFGSALGLLMTQRLHHLERLGGVILFGGFARWKETLAYSISDRDLSMEVVPPDPLNQPVLFLNLAKHLGWEEPAVSRLQGAWLTYIRATWGPPLNATETQRVKVAGDLAAQLPEAERVRFLQGCGLESGAFGLLEPLFREESTLFDWLNPVSPLRSLECPLHVVHGASDNVIPLREGQALFDIIADKPQAQRWFTGLYGHTGVDKAKGPAASSPKAYAAELKTMWGVVNAMASVGCGP